MKSEDDIVQEVLAGLKGEKQPKPIRRLFLYTRGELVEAIRLAVNMSREK